eukprot:PhM_4_TR12197/c0_g1_i1/m.67091
MTAQRIQTLQTVLGLQFRDIISRELVRNPQRRRTELLNTTSSSSWRWTCPSKRFRMIPKTEEKEIDDDDEDEADHVNNNNVDTELLLQLYCQLSHLLASRSVHCFEASHGQLAQPPYDLIQRLRPRQRWIP